MFWILYLYGCRLFDDGLYFKICFASAMRKSIHFHTVQDAFDSTIFPFWATSPEVSVVALVLPVHEFRNRSFWSTTEEIGAFDWPLSSNINSLYSLSLSLSVKTGDRYPGSVWRWQNPPTSTSKAQYSTLYISFVHKAKCRNMFGS